MEFVVRVDTYRNFGTYEHPDSTWGTSLDCIGKKASECAPGSAPANKTLLQWSADPIASFSIISSGKKPSKENGQQIVYADIEQKSTSLVPGHTTIGGPLAGPVTNVRFDSAWYILKNSTTGVESLGSIFTKVNPFLTYSRNPNSGYKQVADHVHTALTRPQDTKPPFTDKQIPGGSWGNPLHRLSQSVSDANKKRVDRNRYHSKKVCNTYFPGWDTAKDPRDGKSVAQCDEFPFASTYEGAARFLPEYDGPRFQDMFSALPVHRDDNGAAGGVLLRWYDWDRILEMDPYYVQVK
ncbi:hypothetical protein [Actinomadura litoris]|uniref:hypothetical protein n=1 Tax=Actinomadura litoris TaxID=2678616 RepID=UPI001FA6F689|nr:hypothetical protein [Actinomadura litoris]